MVLNIPGPFPLVKIQTAPLVNDQTLITVVHGTAIPYAAVYHMDAVGNITFIGRSENPTGKVDSASSVARVSGDVTLFTSQADPNASGTTSKIHAVTFSQAVPFQISGAAQDNYARAEIDRIKHGMSIGAGS